MKTFLYHIKHTLGLKALDYLGCVFFALIYMGMTDARIGYFDFALQHFPRLPEWAQWFANISIFSAPQIIAVAAIGTVFRMRDGSAMFKTLFAIAPFFMNMLAFWSFVSVEQMVLSTKTFLLISLVIYFFLPRKLS